MAQGTDLSEAKRLLLQRFLLRGETGKDTGFPPIPRRFAGQAPLSTSQEQVWLHAQMDLNHPVYNELVTIHRKGTLDVEVLGRALVELVRRHEMWRTTFEVADGEPVQIVRPAPCEINLPFTDLRGLPSSKRKHEALRLAEEDGHIPFDLKRGPVWRARVVQVENEYYQLFMTMHQIVMDGVTGFRVLMPEIAVIYEALAQGQPSPLPELPLQYADYALWQRDSMTDEVLAPQIAYWRKQLSGELPVLQWPNDRPRPPVQTFNGATESLTFPSDLMGLVRSMATSEGATLYMALLASFAALLHRYTGQEDIILGTLTAGRKRPDLEKLMGYFLNPLILRIDLSGQPTFRELLKRVREVVLGALANADVPFLQLVKELQTCRDLSRNPFFTVIVSLEPPATPTSSTWDFTLTEASSGGAKLDMYLNLYERPDGVSIPIMYNPDVFKRSTVIRMHQHWQTFMQAAAVNPQSRLLELPILDRPEREQLVHQWNATRARYPNACVHELFEQQAQQIPHATAVVFEGEALTYAELNRRSNQLAHYLRKRGAEPGQRVGISVTRSLDMIVGLLGILKSGAAYVPMDPAYPRERLRIMQEDAECALFLTETSFQHALPSRIGSIVYLDEDRAAIVRESAENPPARATPESLAYVIYTSGSTGKPKGVQIEHRSVVNLLLSMQREPGLQAQDVMLAVTSISFDIAGLEVYLPLISGARLVVAGSDVVIDGSALMKLLRSSQATIMQATPTTWRLLIEAGWSGRKLKVLCGGEALPQELARRLTARCQSVWNVYGPTETTIWSAIHRVQTNDLALGVQPIGHPIANTEFYVLDTGGRLVPIGIPGELYIGGDGLARGYFNRQQETEARFISHPFSTAPGARLYRTGDLVRYRDNGELEFLGRMDSQVKVRGFRIELGDVETALAACPGIKAAVAAVRHEGLGDAQLLGYVIPHAGQGVTPDEVRQFAKAKLPEYMVPGQITFLESFPLTPNGKVDRKTLPAPDWQLPRKEYVAPRSELEGKLVKAWEATLDRNPIGIRDDFFELGGHSLLGARLMHRLELAGVKLSMAALFTAPTVEKMAALIAAEVPEKRSPAQMIPLQPSGSRPPFFCICVGSWPMYRPLLSRLDQDQPFFGLDLEPSLTDKLSPPYTIRAVAEHLAASVRQQQPEGPYYLGGYCMSGILAYETAQVLLAQGQRVGLLAMFLAYNPAPNSLFSHRTQAGLLVRRVTLRKIREHVGNLWKTEGGKEPTQYVHSRAADFMRDLKSLLWQMSFAWRSRFSGGRLSDVREILYCAAKQFRPEPYPGRVALFRSIVEGNSEITRDPMAGWGEVTRRLLICRVPGDDIEIFDEPNVETMAQELDTCLLEAFAEENTADEVCMA